MSATTDLVRAEWTKLLTTKVGYWLVAVAALMAAGFTALFTAFAGDVGGASRPGDPAGRHRGLQHRGGRHPGQVVVIAVVLGSSA